MRIVFMGSPAGACACLQALLETARDNVVGVVSQPDRPRGRRLKTAACAVKAFARELGLPVLTPSAVNTPESLDRIRELAPDVIVVVAYGQILGTSLLALPAGGCINMHASLLPEYRGAAPVQWAIARGEHTTGVTSMFMNEKMDQGDIILQQAVPIEDTDTACSLRRRLDGVAARLLIKTLDALREGDPPRRAQDGSRASLAPKLTKAHGRIDWTSPAADIYNRIRGFNPWPGCFCTVPGRPARKLKIMEARVGGEAAADAGRSRAPAETAPGAVLSVAGDGFLVATGEGTLRVIEVQPEGKQPMSAASYLCGHKLQVGDSLG
jgi:methionyl-tRNA formyltransferase